MELVSLYPYDPTARATANRIENESITVIPPSHVTDYSYVIPRAAPFYADSLVIKDGKTTGARTLVENVDYWCVIDFLSASVGLGKRISVGIALLDPNYSGTLYVSYQTLGGNYTIADYSVLEELIRERYIVKHVSYEQLINLPAGFSPEWHNHEIGDMVGMGAVVTALSGMKTAVGSRNGSFDQINQQLQNHVNSNQAHTPSDVGLSNLKNYTIGTLNDVKAGTASRYVTADILKQYVDFKKQDIDGYITKSTADESYLSITSINNYYNRAQSDSRYAIKSDTYTKGETDTLINNINISTALGSYYNKTQSDGRYLTKDTIDDYSTTVINDGRYATKTEVGARYSKTESDARYPLKTGVYTKSESDSRYLTSVDFSGVYSKTESDNRFLKSTDVTGFITTTTADSRYQSKTAMSSYYLKSDLDKAKLTSYTFKLHTSSAIDYELRLNQMMPNGGTTYLDVDLTLSNHLKKSEAYTKTQVDTMLSDISTKSEKVNFSNSIKWGAYTITLLWEVVKVGSAFYVSVQNDSEFYLQETSIVLHTGSTTTTPSNDASLRPSAFSTDLRSFDTAFNWIMRGISPNIQLTRSTGDLTYALVFNFDQNDRVRYVNKGGMYLSFMLVATDKTNYDTLNKLMSRATPKSYTP